MEKKRKFLFEISEKNFFSIGKNNIKKYVLEESTHCPTAAAAAPNIFFI